MYNRFDTGLQPREYLPDMASAIVEHNALMRRALNGQGGVSCEAGKEANLSNVTLDLVCGSFSIHERVCAL